jgi:hypothetical protein
MKKCEGMMICKYCQKGRQEVLDTRDERPGKVVRKRKCKNCGRIIFTLEIEDMGKRWDEGCGASTKRISGTYTNPVART